MALRALSEEERPSETSLKDVSPAALGPPSEPCAATAKPLFVTHSDHAKEAIESDTNRELAEAGPSLVKDSEQTSDCSVMGPGSDVSEHFSDIRTVRTTIRAEPLVSEGDVQIACAQNRSTTMVPAEAESPVEATSCRDEASDGNVGSRCVSKADTAAAGIVPRVGPQRASQVRDGSCSTGSTLKAEVDDSAGMNSCDFSSIRYLCLQVNRVSQELLDIVGLAPGDGSDVKPKKHQAARHVGFKKRCGEAVPAQADVIASLAPALFEIGHYREKLLQLLFLPSQCSGRPVGCAAKPPLPNVSDRLRTFGSCDCPPIRQTAASEVAAAAAAAVGNIPSLSSAPPTISSREEVAAGSHMMPDAPALASDTLSRPQEEEDVEQGEREEELQQQQKAELPSDGPLASNYTPTEAVAIADSGRAGRSPTTATHRRPSAVLCQDCPAVLRREMVDGNMIVGSNAITDSSVFNSTEAIPESSSLKASCPTDNKSLPLILGCRGCSPIVGTATLHHHATSSCADTKTAAATDSRVASGDASNASLRNNTNADGPWVTRLTPEPKIAHKASTAADDAACSFDHIVPEAIRTLTLPFNAAACTPCIGPLGKGHGHPLGQYGVPPKTSSRCSPARGRGRSTRPGYLSPPDISRLSSSSSGIATAPPTDGDIGTCSSERFSGMARKNPGDAVDEKNASRQENASVGSDPGRRVAAASSTIGRAEERPSSTLPINIQSVSTPSSSSAASVQQILATDPSSRGRLQEISWPSSGGDSEFGLALTLLQTERLDVKCFDVAVIPYGFVVMATDSGLYLCQIGGAWHPRLLSVGSNQCYLCVAAVPDGADACIGGSAQSGRYTMLVAGNKASRCLELLTLSGSWPDVVCEVVRVLLEDNLPWRVTVDREGRTAAVSSGRFVYTVSLDGSCNHRRLSIGYTVSALAYGCQALVVGSKEKQGGRYALEARDASNVDHQLWKQFLDEAVNGLLCDLDSHWYLLPARSQSVRIISASDGVQLAEVTLGDSRLPATAIGATSMWLVFLLGDRTLAKFEMRDVQWRAAKF